MTTGGAPDLGEWDEGPVPNLVDDDPEQTPAAAAPGPAVDEPPPLFYATLPEFVEQFLLALYVRPHGHGRLWCTRWWAHPEVVYRFDALWRAWEHLRLDPATGASTWLRDHADPHMTAVMAPDGPLSKCNAANKGHSDGLRPLPADPAPGGLYVPVGRSEAAWQGGDREARPV